MPSPEGRKKLTLTVSEEMDGTISRLAEKRGITATELLRRTVVVMEAVDHAQNRCGDQPVSLVAFGVEGEPTLLGTIPQSL